MPVRRQFFTVLVLLLALFGAGCGDREGAALPAEIDDPYYLQGKQLQKQGRNPEALNAFLKAIDRRGDNPCPESHLESGLIYLNHTKDPLAACYHFRRYLKAHPNSKQTPYVLGMVEAAKREFARTLPGRPLDDQSVRMAFDEEVGKLRRDNEELRAEVAVLRGGGAVPVNRMPRMISLSPEVLATPPPVAASFDSPVTPAPATPRIIPATRLPVATSPQITAPAPRGGAPMAASTRSGASAVRAHTVVAKDTLYSIARRYNVKVEEIAAANPTTVPKVGASLRVGTVLKIP